MVFLQRTHSLRVAIWPWILIFLSLKKQAFGPNEKEIAALDSYEHFWRNPLCPKALQSWRWSKGHNPPWAPSTKHPSFSPLKCSLHPEATNTPQPSHLEEIPDDRHKSPATNITSLLAAHLSPACTQTHCKAKQKTKTDRQKAHRTQRKAPGTTELLKLSHTRLPWPVTAYGMKRTACVWSYF